MHNGSLCSSSVILKIVSEASQSRFSITSSLELLHLIPLIWWTMTQVVIWPHHRAALPPKWLTEQRDGAVICSGTERCYCRGCSLLIGHDGELRCGSAEVRGRWLLAASRPVLPSCHIWFLCVETVAVSSGACK